MTSLLPQVLSIRAANKHRPVSQDLVRRQEIFYGPQPGTVFTTGRSNTWFGRWYPSPSVLAKRNPQTPATSRWSTRQEPSKFPPAIKQRRKQKERPESSVIKLRMLDSDGNIQQAIEGRLQRMELTMTPCYCIAAPFRQRQTNELTNIFKMPFVQESNVTVKQFPADIYSRTETAKQDLSTNLRRLEKPRPRKFSIPESLLTSRSKTESNITTKLEGEKRSVHFNVHHEIREYEPSKPVAVSSLRF
ncbi:unnamed protein product [Dimorphilus gyrociliatus]|uniref:Uncharacterized protein n=1 Tax=Dimorphilus gyrociliatus TaxID=2664684 RepID=A0A7I8VNG1_9ANNE|nr:unnamed protein product [Dimorphilus gyrociliatus]